MTRVLAFIVLFFPLVVQAQTGSIVGRITDQSGQPLPGSHITVEGTRHGTTASASGQFRLADVSAGEHVVVVSNVGYRTVRLAHVVRSSEVTDLSVRLEETAIEIDEVVVERLTLTGGAAGVGRIPGSAHYLSPQHLERHSYGDVNRVLRMIPGVNVQEEEGYGLRPSIGMRGTGLERNTKITVMEDGVLAAPAPYAAPAAYFFPTMGRMQAVEVRKGSSQVKYGPYTTGGALNLISSQVPERLTGRADFFVGSDFTRTLHANIGNTTGRVGFLVEGHHSGSEGFKQLDGGGDTGFERTDLLARVRFSAGPEARLPQSVQIKAGLVRDDSDETYLGLTEADFQATPFRRYAGSQFDNILMDQRQLSLRHVIQPAANIDVTTTAYYQDVARNWYKLDAVDPGADAPRVSISAMLNDPSTHAEAYRIVAGGTSASDAPLQVKANNREYQSRGIQTAVGLSGGRAGLRHELEVGARYHEDQEDRIQWVDGYRMDDGVMTRTVQGARGSDSNQIEKAFAVAAYAQYRLEAGRFGFTPGLRYENVVRRRDNYGTSDPDRTGASLSTRRNAVDVWIPGVGIDYRIIDGLFAFGGVHKGFAPPGSGPGARPEESVSYELGGRYRSGLVSAEITGFFSDYSNLLGTDLTAGGGEGTGRLFNGGAVHAGGLEAAASFNLGPAINWAVSVPVSAVYTFTEAQFRSNFRSDFSPWGTVEVGDRMPYLPKHQAAATLGVESARAGAYLTGRYVSRVRTVAGQDALTDANSLDASFLIDLSMEYTLARQSRLFASVRNLTDEVYVTARRPAGYRPGMPRTFVVGIKTSI